MCIPSLAEFNTTKYVFLQKMTESHHDWKKMKRKVHRTKEEGICMNVSVLQTRNTAILKKITNCTQYFEPNFKEIKHLDKGRPHPLLKGARACFNGLTELNNNLLF